MASSAPYPDPTDAPMGGPGLYGNQNGGTSPGQQQQHLPTDADLQMHENLAQLQRNTAMMQHPGPPQDQQMNPLTAHHHFQSPPRPTHSPQQMAQTVMSMEDHNMYSDHDSASRKRSKVSRACDECRRKKIRCDATSENGPEACSSCKRTGARCQFSRQPMKRGPSKGYIKELADRLNSLENQIQNPHAPSQPYDYAALNDHALGDAHTPSHLARKRTHSMSESLQDPYTRPNWPGQDRGDFSTNGQNMRRTSFSDMTLAGNLITGSNEGTIKAYYNCIHPVLPILPHDTSSLNRLTNCPAKLRELFFLALECGVRALSPAALPPLDADFPQLLQQGLETLGIALNTIHEPDYARNFYNDLVYSQSLLFLILASDKPGSSIGTSEMLGRLVGRISALGLNDAKTMMNLRNQDRETFDEGRRLFWTTFILDRFHASTRNKDPIFNLQHATVSRDDYHALGEIGYHLARAADIVGQIAQVNRAGSVLDIDPSSPFAFQQLTNSAPQSLFLSGQISRFRESLDITDLIDSSPPRLAYQYLRIVSSRLVLHTSPRELLAMTKELLHNLIMTQITPLHHMFAQLVAISLNDLSDRLDTQVEAHACIKEMDDALTNGNFAHRASNGSGWDTAIRNILHQKKALTPPASQAERTSPAATQPNMAGLQHLAAAAVGEREVDVPRPSSSGGNGIVSSQPPQDTMKHDVTAAMAAASEAAAAQATAAAAQQQLQGVNTTNDNGNNAGNTNGNANNTSYDSSALVKDAF